MKNRALMTVFAAVAAPVSHAAVIDQISTNINNVWTDTVHWDGGAAVIGSNDYVANSRLRTTTTASTWAGNSLQLDSGADLQMRNAAAQTGTLITVTVADLILNGGQINASTGSDTKFGLDGNITVTADSRIKLYQNGASNTKRSMVIDSLISGSSGVSLTAYRGSDVDNAYTEITNPANTFAGTWVSDDARLIFKDAGAVGFGNLEVTNDGYARVNTDWSGGSISAVSGAEIGVNSGVIYTLDSLSFNGGLVAADTYSIAEINTELGETLFSGTGTVVVIPEPSAAFLAAFGLLGLLRRRR